VFEDTIRRVSRVLGIPENGVALDTLISELTKQDILTALKAKRARAAAGLRTSAAHARWEEIQLGDVSPVIEFTRELMAAHLG
jgi:ribosomal protein L12E/L44/L45/RPP1/RPP2